MDPAAPARDELDALLIQATGNRHSVRWRGHVLWATPAHPGVRYLSGRSSTDHDVARDVAELVGGRRAFVVLDSDHSAEHVFQELVLYARLIHVGDHLLVQDGNMLTTLGMPEELTPIGGITRFLCQHPAFVVDGGKSPFPTSAHVSGWLRRTA